MSEDRVRPTWGSFRCSRCGKLIATMTPQLETNYPPEGLCPLCRERRETYRLIENINRGFGLLPIRDNEKAH